MANETTEARTADDLEGEALGLLAEMRNLRDQLAELAYRRPPLGFKDITTDNCNFPDRTIKAQVGALRDRYETIDHELLTRGIPRNESLDKWELLAGGSERFVVREVDPLPDQRGDGPLYQVVDSDSGEAESFDDEDEATDAARQYNHEDTMENLHGFPFAQNIGFRIERYEVDTFASAGFLVWSFDGDAVIAGVDGGGYDQIGAHWSQVFYAKRKGSIIDSDTGPRRLE